MLCYTVYGKIAEGKSYHSYEAKLPFTGKVSQLALSCKRKEDYCAANFHEWLKSHESFSFNALFYMLIGEM